MRNLPSACLKWSIQIVCMMADVMLILATIACAYIVVAAKSLLLSVIVAVIVAKAYIAWKSQGGFLSWKYRKQFMENWDKNVNKAP